MKAFLMYKESDFDIHRQLPSNEEALVQDLELNTLFDAMALGDPFLYDVAKSAILSGVSNDLNTIAYRQNILKDCLINPFVVRALYIIAVEAMKREKASHWGIFSDSPDAILRRSVFVLQMFMTLLRELKRVADKQAERFKSEGFTAFFAMLKRELNDEYFASVQEHIRVLKFRSGVLISSELEKGNKGTNYVLRRSESAEQGWVNQIFAEKAPVYSFQINPRDQAGARALSELKDRGLNLVANALAQSNDHILSFFSMLRTELAFYIGCLKLHGQLAQKAKAISFPVPVTSSERKHSCRGLYDVCLTLRLGQGIVSNDMNADSKDLVIITGANQGGKSTFLRSIGVSQLMMQCGMFAPAESFSSNICDGLFTHYKREEDATLKSGKLDEELSRMSDIVENITPHSMVLFNESFAATNEREGSAIARQIISALVEKGIKVFFVTHLYEFAHVFCERKMENVLFLRAEREADGRRTFILFEGEPLQTSFGEDLYNNIFGGLTDRRMTAVLTSARI